MAPTTTARRTATPPRPVTGHHAMPSTPQGDIRVREAQSALEQAEHALAAATNRAVELEARLAPSYLRQQAEDGADVVDTAVEVAKQHAEALVRQRAALAVVEQRRAALEKTTDTVRGEILAELATQQPPRVRRILTALTELGAAIEDHALLVRSACIAADGRPHRLGSIALPEDFQRRLGGVLGQWAPAVAAMLCDKPE